LLAVGYHEVLLSRTAAASWPGWLSRSGLNPPRSRPMENRWRSPVARRADLGKCRFGTWKKTLKLSLMIGYDTCYGARGPNGKMVSYKLPG
jgi:hypothetical protein